MTISPDEVATPDLRKMAIVARSVWDQQEAVDPPAPAKYDDVSPADHSHLRLTVF
jgi:hypothetical protein